MYTRIDIDNVDAWPAELLAFLRDHHDVFLAWEGGAGAKIPQVWDLAIEVLGTKLRPYSIRGWHCSRLTAQEINDILSDGLRIPNLEMLSRRIDRLADSGAISLEIGQILKARNQAHEANRAGMLWFCFFPPRLAGERGIERFFRLWGGEALYNSHEDDPAMSEVLSRLGIPVLVEADVPIASLKWLPGIAMNISRRYVAWHGLHTEPLEHEDKIVQSLSANHVRRVIHFQDPDFALLTGCASWRRPLS